jgi:ankyrin repeat protein
MSREQLDIFTLIGKGDVKKLVQRASDGNKFNSNEVNVDGYSLLHWAIIKGRGAIVKFLISHNADVRFKTSKGLNAIELSVYCSKLKIFLMLIDLYTKKEQQMLLHLTAALDRVNFLSVLIDRGLNINSKDQSRRTPLHWAAQEGALSTARMLLNNNAKVDLRDVEAFTPLAISVGEGHIKIVKLLIRNGANVNKKIFDEAIIHIACAWDQADVVSFLLRSGANVNVINGDGQTPVHIAVSNCYEKTVIALVKVKPKLNIKDLHGMTAYDMAKNCGRKIQSILEFVIE